MLAEIELADELRWVETKTGFYTDGRLHSMSNSWEFLTLPAPGADRQVPPRPHDPARLAIEELEEPRTDPRRGLAAPLVRPANVREDLAAAPAGSKLGESYKIASAAFIWAIIARMYAARRSGLKKEMFGYVRGGYARILERFADHLATGGRRFAHESARRQRR